jgi:hypothetical protein
MDMRRLKTIALCFGLTAATLASQDVSPVMAETTKQHLTSSVSPLKSELSDDAKGWCPSWLAVEQHLHTETAAVLCTASNPLGLGNLTPAKISGQNGGSQ